MVDGDDDDGCSEGDAVGEEDDGVKVGEDVGVDDDGRSVGVADGKEDDGVEVGCDVGVEDDENIIYLINHYFSKMDQRCYVIHHEVNLKDAEAFLEKEKVDAVLLDDQ